MTCSSAIPREPLTKIQSPGWVAAAARLAACCGESAWTAGSPAAWAARLACLARSPTVISCASRQLAATSPICRCSASSSLPSFQHVAQHGYRARRSGECGQRAQGGGGRVGVGVVAVVEHVAAVQGHDLSAMFGFAPPATGHARTRAAAHPAPSRGGGGQRRVVGLVRADERNVATTRLGPMVARLSPPTGSAARPRCLRRSARAHDTPGQGFARARGLESCPRRDG